MSEKLNITYRPIKELKPYKKNAKKHNKEQVEQIANSIKEFGFTQPVIIDSSNRQRHEAERLTVKELKKYDINKIYNISAEDDKIYICF